LSLFMVIYVSWFMWVKVLPSKDRAASAIE
jgi:hypothetical protein